MTEHTPRQARGRKPCQYCGEPESLTRIRVGAVVCFDCAEPGGRHDQEILATEWFAKLGELYIAHFEQMDGKENTPCADSTD